MTTGGLWSCFDDRWGWSRGGRGGIGVVRGNHARENWCNGSRGRLVSGRSLRWDGGRRRGPMRNEEGPTVDSRCGVLRIAWFGITCYFVGGVVGGRGHVGCYNPSHRNKACVVVRTWCDGGMGSAWWYRVGHRSMRVVG